MAAKKVKVHIKMPHTSLIHLLNEVLLALYQSLYCATHTVNLKKNQ